MRLRGFWITALVAIIGGGIVSRLVHTGFELFDKYLGDALYAAMAYAILRVFWPFAKSTRIAILTMAVMTALELFQLTLIPARLFTSDSAALRIIARLMGTEFSPADLAAYAVGIGCILLIDRRASPMPR